MTDRTTDKTRQTPSDAPPRDDRAARLKAALKANLARRKAQVRERAGGEGAKPGRAAED